MQRLWVQGFPTEVLQLFAGEAPLWPPGQWFPEQSLREEPPHAGVWHEVWAPLVLRPTVLDSAGSPGPPGPLLGGAVALEKVMCHPSQNANHPSKCYGFASAFLQVSVLRGGQQNLSFLPGSTLPPPLTEIPVPVQQVINHTLNSAHDSGHPAVPKSLLQRGQSSPWFVIQSSISLGNVQYSQVSKMAIWLFFSHALCYLIQNNIFFPNNLFPKYCWHGR